MLIYRSVQFAARIQYFLNVFLTVILVSAQLYSRRRFVLKISFMDLILANLPQYN